MKKVIFGLLASAMGLSLVSAPVFAECTPEQLEAHCVNTAILGHDGCSCEDASGADGAHGRGVVEIILLVIDIMTVGVGIIGVISIMVVGIQYLTAGGSEEKVRNAKRRIFEIVIGLAAYAIMYYFLKWLLPTFIPS